MNTTDEDKESLAALYALGALDESERLEADMRYRADSQWESLLGEWQQRLDPMNRLVEPVEPPSSLWNRIEEQLGEQQVGQWAPDVNLGEPENRTVAPIPERRVARPQPEQPGLIEETIELWRQRARYWQTATLASVVAIACIAGVLVFKPFPEQSPQGPLALPRTVAILQSEDNEPLWAVSLRQFETTGEGESGPYGELLVTVVGDPQIETTQSHQMWMVLKDAEGVQSVGLLPDSTGEVRRLVLPRPLSDATELAVSLEPKGGVPGPEHGPVVTRTFVVSATIGDAL